MAWRTAMGATRISVHATKCGSQRPKSRRKRAGFQPSGVATAIPTAQGANGARATVRRMFRRTMPDSVSGESIRPLTSDAMPKDRKSVVEGKSVSVRVDLGGRRIIKKKKKQEQSKQET